MSENIIGHQPPEKPTEIIVMNDNGVEEVITPDRIWEFSRDAMHQQPADYQRLIGEE